MFLTTNWIEQSFTLRLQITVQAAFYFQCPVPLRPNQINFGCIIAKKATLETLMGHEGAQGMDQWKAL